MSRQCAALSFDTQHAMLPEFCGIWGTVCLNIMFSLSILLYHGYSAKLIYFDLKQCLVNYGESEENSVLSLDSLWILCCAIQCKTEKILKLLFTYIYTSIHINKIKSISLCYFQVHIVIDSIPKHNKTILTFLSVCLCVYPG